MQKTIQIFKLKKGKKVEQTTSSQKFSEIFKEFPGQIQKNLSSYLRTHAKKQ